MVPSITTYNHKDGSKRKHRYYICGVFHNKGSTSCIVNSIRAYNAEDEVMDRLKHFLNYSAGFYKTIESINKDTVQTNLKLKQQLERIENELTKAHTFKKNIWKNSNIICFLY